MGDLLATAPAQLRRAPPDPVGTARVRAALSASPGPTPGGGPRGPAARALRQRTGRRDRSAPGPQRSRPDLRTSRWLTGGPSTGRRLTDRVAGAPRVSTGSLPAELAGGHSQAELCRIRWPGTCRLATGLSATERRSVSDRRARPETTGCFPAAATARRHTC